MNVLVINCGSSSVKICLFALDVDERVLARGAAERVDDHGATVRRLITDLGHQRVDAVGHRIVHGGSRFRTPILIDDAVVTDLTDLTELAPLHNAPGIAGIHAARAALGGAVPMVAVFDTAFHATLPELAWRYALPRDATDRHRVRRYGFHGLSCRAVLARYAALTGVPVDRATVIVLHLGNGCSATAIQDGHSVDTSMGLTPLEGLVMGTRSGDVDPALPGFLARAEGTTIEAIEDILNHRSGLLGLSETSADMRDLLTRAATDERARLAVDMFCYRARKYVGAYLAALGGAQAIVFTGGIGEHSPEIRHTICQGLEWCGVAVDRVRNASILGAEAPVSTDDARIAVWVIPTDEERVIAGDVRAVRSVGAQGSATDVRFHE